MTCRVGTYTYQLTYPTWPDGPQDVTAVTPPMGSGWSFEYGATSIDLTKITTPNGGRIEYDWYLDESSHYLQRRDTYDRGGTHLGRWEIILTNPFNHAFPDVLKVRLPGPSGGVTTGETIVFHHSDMATALANAQHAVVPRFVSESPVRGKLLLRTGWPRQIGPKVIRSNVVAQSVVRSEAC